MAWMLVVSIAVAGALGALARWFLSEAMQAMLGEGGPYGAFAANVLGCAAFGFLLQYSATGVLGPQLKLALLVGFLGSFTTFSTYVADVVTLVQNDQLARACVWVMAHNAAGLAFFLVGTRVARSLS